MDGSRGIQIAMVVLATIFFIIAVSDATPMDDSKFILLISMVVITGACIMNPIISIGKKLDEILDKIINKEKKND